MFCFRRSQALCATAGAMLRAHGNRNIGNIGMDEEITRWLTKQDAKYRTEAEALIVRIRALAPAAPLRFHGAAILGFGTGADDFMLIGLAVRKDGIRFYANAAVLAQHKATLGKRLSGKTCVTLKHASDLEPKLLDTIVKESLKAKSIAAE